MIVLGILLVLVAVGAGAAIFVGTSPLSSQADQVQLDVLGVTVGLTPLALAIAGAATMLVLWLGLLMVRGGSRRRVRQRRAAKEETRVAQEQQAVRERELAAERDRVQAERDRIGETADQRVAEQRRATETARQRAEVAENKLAAERATGDGPADSAR